MSGPATGTRVGPALARLMADARIAAHHETHAAEVDASVRQTEAFLEGIEQHLAPQVAMLFAELRDSGNLPDGLAAVLDQATSPTEQFDFIANIALLIMSVFFQAGALTQPFVQHYLNNLWSEHLYVPLTPAEVALNELRGGVYKGAGVGEAALTGMGPGRYEALLENTGEPPAIQELLFLVRRGKIGTGELERGIRQSRVRDEWIGAVTELMYGPPSAGEAIGAAVRNLLSDGEAAQIMAENGIDPVNYDWMRAAAGRPPGIEQMLQLLNRGIVDEGTVTQAIRESDVKDKYIGSILEMRRHLMPERTVVAGISKGVLTHEQGIQHLLLLGFSAEDAAALAGEATTAKVAAAKQLNESLIVSGYENGLLGHDDAVSHLGALGFDQAEADYILAVADAKIDHARHDAAVSRIRSFYVAHRLDEPSTRTDLTHLGVPGATQDALVALWTVERDANPAQLTVAELGRALKAGWIGLTDYVARLVQRGYSSADAGLLGALATGARPATPVV